MMIAMRLLSRRTLFVLLLASASTALADVCVYKPPSVRRIVGVVVDPSGEAIPGAEITIRRDGRIIKSITTKESGEFVFDSLPQAEYGIHVTANWFQNAFYKVRLPRPRKSWDRKLRIELGIGELHCGGGISFVEHGPSHQR